MFPDEDIPNRSPVRMTPRTRVPVADERDFSTLQILLGLVEEAEAKARDNTTLDRTNKDVPLEAQLYGLTWALDTLILPFRNAVFNAVENVKTQNRGEE